jgi:glycosyltransferase involved in cell wall biosynthesis
MPFFSIIIPTYNRSNQLKYTITSVLNQSFQDFELLIMDDGSTDDTEVIVKSFNDTRIIYSWKVNSGGPATPRNRGIQIAKGKWLSFLDADDIWYSDRLLTVFNNINNNPNSDVFCHNEMLNNRDSHIKTPLFYGPFTINFYQNLLIKGNCLSTSATTIRSSLIIEHKIDFNTSEDYVIVEDYDFWLKLAYHNANFYFIPDILGEYIIQNDNISHDNSKSFKNEKNVLKNHVYNIQKFEINKNKLWKKTFVRMEIGKLINLLKLDTILSFIFYTIIITYKYHIYVLPHIYYKVNRRLFYINK